MTKLLALAAALMFTACIDESEAPSEPTVYLAGEAASAATPTQPVDDCGTPRSKRNPADDEKSVCTRLPTNGACALACDPDQMIAQFVPEGTCALISCVTTDGEAFTTGGCNL